MINENIENYPNELTLFLIKGINNDRRFSGDRLSSDGGLLFFVSWTTS